jgi:Putative ABC exporter
VIAAERTISPGSALRTLLYLDAHILLNRMRMVARNPLRLILWLVFLLAIVSSIQARTMMREAIRSRPVLPPGAPFPVFLDPTPWLHTAATFLPGIILLVFGVFTIGSCRQPLPAFRSAADARFLCGSALPPRLVVLWLVVRVILSLSWRIPMMLLFFIVVLPALGVSVASGFSAFFALLLLTTTVALNLPIFISRQRHLGPDPALVGWLLVLTGLCAVAVVFVARSPGAPILPSALQSVAVALPPGSWLVGAFEGNGLSLIALSALAVGSLTLTWMVAGDVYPELWLTSARVIVLRRALRRRGPFMTRSDQRQLLSEAGIAQPSRHRRQTAAGASRGRWVPSGAWTILWKEWLATRRVAGGMRTPAIALLVAVLLGAAVGRLSRNDPAVVGLVLGPLAYVAVFGSLFTAYRMSGDLRKPIWWLSASTLRSRLAVMLIARSLRTAIPISAGLLTASVVSGNIAFLLVGAPIAAAAIWAINAMGLATYALIPGSADMRGPGGCLRVIALFIMLIPIAIAAAVGGIATQSGVGSLVATVLTALAEGWLLLVFAASQLDGNGLAFAQAERR